ncbi:lipopolysaccharide biosynthesis protein [Halobaculum marinum]|uniref:Lipopolysaccharide biosynthesis protein n=1 Tax=Halobaculum marinum TaxID=3031996 RepID=A0ABD5WVS9_9EURY|nr:oligosaccharide flippase family protein [Halobaculum sp. DT55]
MTDQNTLPFQRLLRRFARAVRAVGTDDLVHHGGVMAAATVVAGGFNYGYQVFVGRYLGAEAYGAFGALFALFYLLHVVGRGVRFSASRFAAELDGPDERAAFYRGFLLRSVALGVGGTVLLVAASPAIAGFLGLDSAAPVTVVAAAIGVELVLTANQGTLQGLQRFGALGVFKVAQAAVKLALGVALVLAGFRLYGAFAAVVLGSAVVLVASTAYLLRELGTASAAQTAFRYRRAYRYVVPAAIAGFCLTVPANADVVVVKHFFPAVDAGHYAAASVLGKVLLFLPMGISTALFPKVTADHAAARSERLHALFDRALGYAALVAAAGAVGFWLVAEELLLLAYGPEFVAAAPLVRWYGLAISAVVLAVVVLNFELARDRTGYVYLFALGSVAELALIWTVHDTLIQVAQLVLVANAALFLAGLATVKLDLDLHPTRLTNALSTSNE